MVNATKRTRDMPEYICSICGEKIRGNGFGRHEASCRRKQQLGDCKQIYPVPLPVGLYDSFAQWCEGEGLTLAEGVHRLVKEKIG